MNEKLTKNLHFEQNFFDHERAISIVESNGVFTKCAVLEPSDLLDTSVDIISTQVPSEFWLYQANVRPEIVPLQKQFFDSNKRLKLGKVNRSIIEFAVSRVIGFNGGHNQFSPLKRLPYMKVNDAHMDLVVGEINVRQRDEFNEGELTFSLRNKGVKAKDIQIILGALVYHYGALKIVESTHTESPSVGRKPSKKYQVLWGASKFFPQPPESKENQE